MAALSGPQILSGGGEDSGSDRLIDVHHRRYRGWAARYRGNVGKGYDTRTASAGLAGSGMGLQPCIEKLEPRKL